MSLQSEDLILHCKKYLGDFKAPSKIYFLDELPSEINPISILIIFLFSIFITALASFFPAKAVSRMDTIKALKYE